MNDIRRYINIVETASNNDCNLLTEDFADPEQIAKSLFSLIKTNGGRYKTEKQAKFLLKITKGFHSYSSFMSFGSSRKANPSTTFDFELDDQGVYKVFKETPAAGRNLWWERTPEYIKKVADAERRKAEQKEQRNKVEIDDARRRIETTENEKRTCKLKLQQELSELTLEKFTEGVPEYQLTDEKIKKYERFIAKEIANVTQEYNEHIQFLDSCIDRAIEEIRSLGGEY